MATRHEITSIQFKADAGKANAAIDSIRQKAKEANEQMTQLRQKLEEGKKANLPTEQIQQMEAELDKATKAAKQWGDAQKNLMRGVKALDQAIIEFNKGQGSVEKMSAALSKAARNAAQLQQSRMERGSEGWHEMEALILALDKNLLKARQDFDGLVQTIQSGGQVSVTELTSAKQSLKELSDLTAFGSDEWKQYKSQLDTVSNRLASIGETERRLAGEVVTVNDAIKMSHALSKEAAEIRATAAKEHLDNERKELAAVQENLELSKKKIATTERELTATKEKIAAQQELVGSIRALEDAEDKAEAKTSAAETALRQARGEQQKFGDAAWEAAKKVGELEKKLEELNKEPVASKNPVIEAVKSGSEEAIATLDEVEARLKKVIKSDGFDHDKLASTLSMDADNATRRAALRLGKFSGLVDTDQQSSGFWGTSTAIDKNMRNMVVEDAALQHFGRAETWGVNTDDTQVHFVTANGKYVDLDDIRDLTSEEQMKVAKMSAKQLRNFVEKLIKEQYGEIKAVMKSDEFGDYHYGNVNDIKKVANVEVWKEGKPVGVSETQEEIAAREKLIEQTRQLIQEEKGLSEETKNQVSTTQASVDIDKEKAEIQQQLADAQKKLNDAKQAAEEPTRKLKEAEKNLADAQSEEKQATEALTKARGNMNVADEEQKLDALERQHDDLTESLSKQKQAETELAQAAVDARQNEKEAAIELAQAQNVTQESLENAIAVLEKQQKKTADGTEEYDQQAESLTRLRERLNEMKGEWMSLADAQRLAEEAGTNAFIASPEQLQKATAAIERRKKQLQETIQLQRRSGAATDAEEKELKELEVQLKKLKMEQDNFNMSHSRMDALLKQPTNAKNLDELRAAIKRAKAELNSMEDSLGKNSKAYKDMAADTKKAEIQLKEMEAQAKGTASAFDKAWSRLKTYVTLYVGAAVAMQKLVSTMGDLMELSDKMGEVRKTTGFSADEVGRLSDNLAKLDTRTPIQELLGLSATAGQLGLKSEEDVRGFTEAANMLMVALPEMGREGATQMLKVALATGEIDRIGEQMRNGTIEGSSKVAVAMEKIGSTIDQLRANSAAAAPAITDFVQRVGAVGAQSGISIDQVAALGSTVDALGMRVEMSATALSRMIPAIKNNAFEVARAINVTPDTLRNLFDTGRGMEAILMIFQHIKDAGMDEDSIESMLGMGNMKEIMKELNQMGARAGIVFSGLSQNVDELRRQLGVAKTAYEENTAIQNEYNKMNDTTAAKWERLKNTVEELFVKDSWQRGLGWVIERLRDIVDLLSGNGGISIAIQTILIYLGVLRLKLADIVVGGVKALWNGIKNIGVAIGVVRGEITKMQMANIFTALAAAVMYAYYAFQKWHSKQMESAREAARFQAELDKEQKKVNELTDSIGNARVKIESANKEVEKAKAALDAAKKSTDGSAESTKRLAKAETDLVSAEEKKRDAMATSKRLIEQFNSQYSQYLGFMLSEVSSNIELARARDLVNSKLRETLTLKRQEAAIERVEKDKGGARDEEYANLYDFVGRFTEEDPTQRPRVMAALVQAAKSAKDKAAFSAQAKKIFKDNNVRSSDALLRQAVDYFDEEMNVREATEQVMEQFKGEQTANRKMSQGYLVLQASAGFSNYNKLLKDFQNSNKSNRAQRAAAVLQQMDTMMEIKDNASSYFDLSNPEEEKQYKKRFRALISWQPYDRNALLKAAGSYYKSRKTMEGDNNQFTPSNKYTSGSTDENLWGNVVDATSTEYSTWDVNELVRRRQQMNKFKNVLKPGIEVRKVLAEDKALMKAIDEGKVGEDWQSVLNWYNAERLKIQKELKGERFSTNEGNWRDEKNGRKRKNPFIESDYALAELDRYYSRRKEALEKARSEENISEELYNRQLEILEQEHLERRSTLRATFTKEISNKEIQQFRKWWDVLEKQDELDHVPWATVESEWSKAIAAQIGRNNLRMQQDMTKVESITMKHVNAIAKIIAKERPYDSITENLQANLTKLDILFADLGAITKQQLEDGTLANELNRRLSFLLEEAEHAYSLNAEQLMSDMEEKGFRAWVSAIANAENADELKQRLLAQLRTAYDAVQDAIKKEASLIKKQAEIQWNDTFVGGKSQKQIYEGALSALGLSEDQVKRANSLIGAGPASERVADRLAIKQMQIQLAMQAQYYALMRKIGEERIKQLEAAGKLEDAEHLRKSLNLSLSEEQKKLDEQRVAIQNQLEESQNRLYTELKVWADLISSSLQNVFEASHAGDAEYYNERAKLNLTGKGGPGAGTYIVIENEGTSDARAHYEYLNEREALERQREIENQNALAEAWRKLMDDINMKLSETITDQLNAMLQNQSIDANTQAVLANTEALYETAGGEGKEGPAAKPLGTVAAGGSGRTAAYGEGGGEWLSPIAPQGGEPGADYMAPWTEWAEQSSKATETMVGNNKKVEQSTQSAFARMTMAANMYGIAYQAMSNENLNTTQKFSMMALQAVGNYAIGALTAEMASASAKAATDSPGVLGTLWKQLGWAAAPVFAIFTGLLGGLMGLATSKITKAKGQIAQVTGAGHASAGRLSTGMLQYAEGNVNEFTDPSSLREGQTYQVDAANGKTYKARYMGKGAKTHITNGPEFHLVGEEGREAIIDAKTTRHIRFNEPEVWRYIQTLYNGGSLSHLPRRRGRGVAAFADGNLDEMGSGGTAAYGESGLSPEQVMAMQASLDRNSEVLERALSEGIKGVFDVYGKGGLVDSYDTGKKTVKRHGERY